MIPQLTIIILVTGHLCFVHGCLNGFLRDLNALVDGRAQASRCVDGVLVNTGRGVVDDGAVVVVELDFLAVLVLDSRAILAFDLVDCCVVAVDR